MPSCVWPWIQLLASCYRFVDKPMNWFAADTLCRKLGGQLVEIDTPEENKAVLAEIRKRGFPRQRKQFWMGLTDRTSEGRWVLESNGEGPRFTNWDRRQPSNGWLWIWNEDCAYIKTNEKWNDYSCTKKKMWGWTINALCEKPIKRQPTTTKPPEINVGYEPYEPTGNEPIAIKPTANKACGKKTPVNAFYARTPKHFQVQTRSRFSSKRIFSRIVGGQDADPNEWPWLAAIMYKTSKKSFCGATLITDTHVITAAHCVDRFKPADLRVRVGEYSFKHEGETQDETFKVASKKVHKDWHTKTFEHDIAILRLDGSATRSASVSPICLPSASEQFTDKKAHVIGWGVTSFAGETSSVLQEVEVRVWKNIDCAKNYAEMGRMVLETMLCAAEKRKDSCQGDSGGPLNCLNPSTKNWELCGIVSWGAECADPELPGVYTRVTKYLSWIRNNIDNRAN